MEAHVPRLKTTLALVTVLKDLLEKAVSLVSYNLNNNIKYYKYNN